MQNPVYVDTFTTLGSNPVPMAWPEVYSALETKAIDAQENPFGIIAANKLDEVQKYLSVTTHAYSPYAVMVGHKLWDQLNPAERAILKSACTEARDYQRRVGREADAATVAELKARGMIVNELSADAVAQMRRQLKPVVDKYTAQVGEGLVKQVNAEIDKVRGAQ